ncbi:MAG: helix-turn-helix domain-containing protein [Bacteroidota bacterium]
MTAEAHIPSALLRPFIKAYLIIESREELVNRVLPDTSLVIAFRFKGQVNYVTENNLEALPGSVISGLRKSVRLINYLDNSATFLIRFKEAGAKAFFREPMHELFEESVSLDTFISGHELSLIEEQLAEADNNLQRVAVIEAFLLSKLCNNNPDRLVAAAVQKIHSASGSIKIQELAKSLFISHDAFEKRFRQTVGTSPKQFASLIRMNSVISNTGRESFSDKVFDAGYFDRSHFNKEFKLFTGQTPTDFFKAGLYW